MTMEKAVIISGTLNQAVYDLSSLSDPNMPTALSVFLSSSGNLSKLIEYDIQMDPDTGTATTYAVDFQDIAIGNACFLLIQSDVSLGVQLTIPQDTGDPETVDLRLNVSSTLPNVIPATLLFSTIFVSAITLTNLYPSGVANVKILLGGR